MTSPYTQLMAAFLRAPKVIRTVKEFRLFKGSMTSIFQTRQKSSESIKRLLNMALYLVLFIHYV
jgi:hypothetical protein